MPRLTDRVSKVWQAIGNGAFGESLDELASIHFELKALAQHSPG